MIIVTVAMTRLGLEPRGLIQFVPWAPSSRIKRPELQGYHSPESGADGINTYPDSAFAFFGVVCTHRGLLPLVLLLLCDGQGMQHAWGNTF
jgi:hypothetical protein